MPAAALLAVLAAALLHASWNLVVKSSGERLVAATTQLTLAAIVSLPYLVWRGFPTEALGYLVASSLVQVGYVYSLAAAYDRADLSFVYPLARGTAPLLIALGGVFGLSQPIDGVGWVALGMICGGVIAVALSSRSHAGVAWSLLTGVLIATYITIDGAGVATVEDTISYTAALTGLTALILLPLVLSVRGPALVRMAIRNEWGRHLFAGAATLSSYGLLLYASRMAPLSLVAAARETGVVFATLGGWLLLNERVTRGRAAASLLIAAGVVVLALSR